MIILQKYDCVNIWRVVYKCFFLTFCIKVKKSQALVQKWYLYIYYVAHFTFTLSRTLINCRKNNYDILKEICRCSNRNKKADVLLRGKWHNLSLNWHKKRRQRDLLTLVRYLTTVLHYRCTTFLAFGTRSGLSNENT